jgi:hypothetical protein
MSLLFRIGASVLVLTAVAAHADGAQPLIAVHDAQRVTITGHFDSLRGVVVELCRRAGVELRAYDAADRPLVAGYENIPLADALARLLRSEIYLAGVRADEHRGAGVVAWLRVSGSKAGSSSEPVTQGAALAPVAIALEPGIEAIDLGVAPKIVETALTSSDTAARNNARRLILETLSDDSASLQRYIGRDVTAVVNELAAFPHAVELVGVLQNVTRDMDERNHIQEILRALRLRQIGDDAGNG